MLVAVETSVVLGNQSFMDFFIRNVLDASSYMITHRESVIFHNTYEWQPLPLRKRSEMRGGRSTINDGAGDRFRDFFETSTPDALNLLSKHKAQESALFLAHRELHTYNRDYIPYYCKLSPIQSHSFGLTEYRTFLGRWCGVLSFFPLRVVVRGRVTLHILHYLDSNRNTIHNTQADKRNWIFRNWSL